MIYNFTYNNVPVKVDTTLLKITVPHPTLANVYSSYLVGDFRRDPSARSIIVYPKYQKEDVNGNSISVSSLKARVYGQNSFNSLGENIYDFFYNQEGVFGQIADLACINNQLEEMEDIFQGKCPCFNPFNNWSFYHPIHLTVEVNGTTATITVTDPIVDGNYECSIDNGQTWGSLTLTDLTTGTYTALVRSYELVPAKITFTI